MKHGDIADALNALRESSPVAYYFHNVSFILPFAELLLIFGLKLIGIK